MNVMIDSFRFPGCIKHFPWFQLYNQCLDLESEFLLYDAKFTHLKECYFNYCNQLKWQKISC